MAFLSLGVRGVVNEVKGCGILIIGLRGVVNEVKGCGILIIGLRGVVSKVKGCGILIGYGMGCDNKGVFSLEHCRMSNQVVFEWRWSQGQVSLYAVVKR